MKVLISNISHKYKGSDKLSLENLSMEIVPGSKHGIFGANGAGKSTIIKIICNVFLPSEGKVEYSLDEKILSDKTTIKQSIGYVPQDFAFYEELTIWQNVRYFGTMFNLEKSQIEHKYLELVNRFDLKGHLKKKVKTFSGGMKRKVNLILGLLHDPKIIVLDEPIVGIDVKSKIEILNYLNEIHQKGITIIYTSHQMNESQSFCDNFTLLDCGKNLITGNLEEILSHQGKKDLESILIDLK
jgi:ABC-2 type transport system ATP-binding protein